MVSLIERQTFFHIFVAWITGLLMALILVLPGAYLLLTLWLAGLGLFNLHAFRRQVWRPSLQFMGPWLWLGLGVYVVVGVGLGLFHGYKLSYFEAYVPMLLAPWILNGVVAVRLPQATLWLGAAAGAVLAGMMGSYQSLILDMGRAGGAMNNVIMFGDIAVVLAMISAFGLLYWPKAHMHWARRSLLAVSAIMGLWASLMSGSKGGWLSILMLAALLTWMAFSHWHWSRRLFTVLTALMLVVGMGFLAPQDLVLHRIQSGLQGAHAWFSTGAVTDGSVSIRLEKWSQAFGMIADRPFMGWSSDVAIEELRQRMIAAGAGDGWSQTENDFLQAGIVHGTLGIFSYAVFYLSLILSFSHARKTLANHPQVVGFSVVGVFLVILFLEFGLSIIVLGRNAFRYTLVTWSMVLMGLLLLHAQQQQRSVNGKEIT